MYSFEKDMKERDVLNDKDYSIIEELEVNELIYETLPSLKLVTDWYDKGRFISNFIIIRFIYDNTSQYKFILNNVNVNKQIKNR
jgi:hypothetical protein